MGETLAQLFVETAKGSRMGEQAATQSAMLGQVVTAATIASATWWLDHPDEPRDLVEGRLWLPGEPGDPA